MSPTHMLSPWFWQFLHQFWPAFLLVATGIAASIFASRKFNNRRQRPIASFPMEVLKTAFQFDHAALRRHMKRGTISKAEIDRALSDTHKQIIEELNRR